MTIIRKWGNSLAVRIPAALASQLNIQAGTSVEVSTRNGSLVLTPCARPRYTLRELLKGCTPGQFHREVDFGPEVGREVID